MPNGLRGGLSGSDPDGDTLVRLHQRITAMLQTAVRQDHDEAIVLRLDPLLLAGAQAEDAGLISSLRREFGPEAHLSVTTSGNAVFVMAARAGQENEVAIAIRRRLAALAPSRLTGTRPGILSVFVEDTDRQEWRGLRDRLELEGEARQFMTHQSARPVVAVSFCLPLRDVRRRRTGCRFRWRAALSQSRASRRRISRPGTGDPVVTVIASAIRNARRQLIFITEAAACAMVAWRNCPVARDLRGEHVHCGILP